MKLKNFLATDFHGKKATDDLPKKLVDGSNGGHVLTIANSLVLNLIGSEWFIKTQYKLVIVDKNNDHLLEIDQFVNIAKKCESAKIFREKLVSQFDEASVLALEDRNLVSESVVKGLKCNNRILSLNEDLSDPGVLEKIQTIVKQQPFSLLYLSNVEFYVGADNLFGSSKGGKSDYAKNIRSLISIKTKIYRGSSVIMSEHVGELPKTWCVASKK